MDTGGGDPFLGFFLLIIVLGFYFLPTCIAVLRKKNNGLAIFVLNFLTGWTFVGWIIALVWSLTKDQ